MWIGTIDGLVKYDGFSFEIFNKRQLIKGRINDIYEDSKGTIWVSTNNGLFKIANNSIDRHYFQNNDVRQVLETTNGLLWIATDSGLICQKGNVFIRYSANSGLPGDRIFSLKEDKFKNLWIGTYSGVSKFNGKQFLNYDTNAGLIHDSIISIEESLEGDILLGTTIGITRLFLDKKNDKLNFSEYINLTQDNGLNGWTIPKIIRDNVGNFWFATQPGGVTYFNNFPLKFIDRKNGLENPSILSIYSHNNGNKWFGTDGSGVYILENNSIINLKKEDGLPAERIWTITGTTDGSQIWIGTKSGPALFENDKIYNFTGFTDISIYSIDIDNKGRVWMSSNSGVYMYNNGEFVHFEFDTLLKTKIFYSIYAKQLDKIWIGSNEEGLLKTHYDEDKKVLNIEKLYTVADGFLDNTVWSMAECDNTLWIGTNNGLSSIMSDTVKSVLLAENLETNIIWSVNAFNNKLWLSTENGLIQYNPKSESPIELVINKSFGLKSASFLLDAGEIDSSGIGWWGTPNGVVTIDQNMLLNSKQKAKVNIHALDINGHPISNSDTIRNYSFIEMEKFKNVPDGLRLSPFGNSITFYYSGINWVSNAQLQYQYRLIGLTDTWSSVTTDIKITYNNLSFGNYEFQVRASNNKWSEVSSYKFHVNTPFYFKWWAFVIYGTLLYLILRLINWNSIKKLERQKAILQTAVNFKTKEIQSQKVKIENQSKSLENTNNQLIALNNSKDKLFSIIAHDLRAPLNSIIGLNEIILNSNFTIEEYKAIFSKLYNTTEQASKLLTNLLEWARLQTDTITFNPVKIDLYVIINEVINLLKVTAEAKGITLKYIGDPDCHCTGDYYMLNTVIRNLVSNAIKFSNKGNDVIISSKCTGHSQTFTIKDFGLGMTDEKINKILTTTNFSSSYGTNNEKGTGLGFNIVKEFLNRHNSILKIKKHGGKG